MAATWICSLPRLCGAGALFRPPYSLSVLSACHSALMVMLAQPRFAIALTGQVLMGTVYVFFEANCQELLVLYSRGDHLHYRRLVALHYYCFTAGCALCSPVAYSLYAARGFASAFYASAVFVGAVGLAVALFFAWRMGSTPEGALGSLAAVEDYRADRERTARRGLVRERRPSEKGGAPGCEDTASDGRPLKAGATEAWGA